MTVVTKKELNTEIRYLEGVLGKFILSTDRTIRNLSNEMKEFKDEMKEFKVEMKEFKNEMRGIIKDMNKKWGDLANKLGTFAEDIAAPNIPRIAKEMFGCERILYHAVRIDAANPNVEYGVSEFDAITVCEDMVFLLETKSTVRMKYIEKLPNLLEQFKYCFPQYKGKRLIPVFGSMSVPENVIIKLSKMGFYVMVMGDDNMDIVNFDNVKKKYII